MTLSPSLVLSATEPPQFVKEPERHITAEMEKVVDIPCRAKGNTAVGSKGSKDTPPPPQISSLSCPLHKLF